MQRERVAPRIPLPWLVALLAVFVSMPVLVSACNTTEGVGEDIEAGGDAIEDAAEDAND